MKKHLKVTPALLLATLLLQGCGASHEDSKLTSGGDLELTGRMRVYTSGSQQGIQIDLKNSSNQLMFGPTVSVQLDGFGFFGQGAMYPYFGGNTSTANTIFPNDQGYIP